jgi:biotin transport system substrate-specific component
VDGNRMQLRQMVYAAMFGALTAAGALVAIPLQPVPLTLQTLFTCISGALLGSYAGALSQIIYILLGSLGLPVFAGGKSGLGVLLGPSGGYLLGFVAGAYVIGKMLEKRSDAGWGWVILALIICNLVIYTLGTVQLMAVTHFAWSKAVLVGVVPFLAGDGLKVAAAAGLIRRLRPHIKI